ncbi:hypothetical protein BH20ACT2_BH20ACT2_21720 [soil metagenome]
MNDEASDDDLADEDPAEEPTDEEPTDEELTDEEPTEDGDEAGPGDDATAATSARAVLEYLARSVVDDPDAVNIAVDDGRRGRVTLEVTVAPGDMGRVIGKRGRTANAIRTVVRAAAVKDDIDVDVEFVD